MAPKKGEAAKKRTESKETSESSKKTTRTSVLAQKKGKHVVDNVAKALKLDKTQQLVLLSPAVKDLALGLFNPTVKASPKVKKLAKDAEVSDSLLKLIDSCKKYTQPPVARCNRGKSIDDDSIEVEN